MQIFGYRLVRVSILASNDARLKNAQTHITSLESEKKLFEKSIELLKSLQNEQAHQISILRKQVDENKLAHTMDVDIGDPAPDKPEARRAYVARVAGFHTDILKPKILQMISNFHRLLEDETNDEKTNHYLQVGVFICRELTRWGDGIVSEQMGYQTEPPLTEGEQREVSKVN